MIVELEIWKPEKNGGIWMDKRINQRNMKAIDIVLMAIEIILFFYANCVMDNFLQPHGIHFLGILWLGYIIICVFLGLASQQCFPGQGNQKAGDSWLQTPAVISSGAYGIVRHPMYLSFGFMSLSLVCR
jgi:protein-S-isoprenylcysteine O-methyltransferase Ste14